MNISLKSTLLFCIVTFLFLSCANDDVKQLSLSSQDIALKVGQADTLNAIIKYNDDQTNVPPVVSVSDTTVANAYILKNEAKLENSTSVYSLVVKAKRTGKVNVVIKAGSKSVTCLATITQTTLVLNQSVVVNYGLAIETSDNAVFIMNFFPETFKVDVAAGSINGTGQFIHFESFFPAKVSSFPAGSFTHNSGGKENSFLPGEYYEENGKSYAYGTYIETVGNNQVTYTLVKSGRYVVEINGPLFNIEGDLTTETGEVIHFIYSGPVSIIDASEKPSVVTPAFTKGELYYVGDYYNMGLSSTFFAYLETSNVNLNSTILDGEVLALQLDTYDYYTKSIPNGTYNVLSKPQFDNYAVKPFTIVPGHFYVYQEKSYAGGSLYYNSSSRKRLISGTVTSTLESNHYVIQYSLYDRIGSQVTGTFDAALSYKSLRTPAATQIKSAISEPNSLAETSQMKQQAPFKLRNERLFRIIEKK